MSSITRDFLDNRRLSFALLCTVLYLCPNTDMLITDKFCRKKAGRMNTALDKENSEEFDPFSCKLSYPFLDLVLCSCTLLVGVVVLNSKSRRLTCIWVWYVVFAVSSLFFFFNRFNMLIHYCWSFLYRDAYPNICRYSETGSGLLQRLWWHQLTKISCPHYSFGLEIKTIFQKEIFRFHRY